jgi:rare lipoprotein A (peptidoglycan hydrolase)
VCGKCVEVKGPKGSVVLTVADKCPGKECVKGSIDIAENAFTRIADKDKGRVKVEWKEVPCGAQPDGSSASPAPNNRNNQTSTNANNQPAGNSPPGRDNKVISSGAEKVTIIAQGLVTLGVAASLTTLL